MSISSVFTSPLAPASVDRDEVATMGAVFEQRRADPTVGVLETMLILDGEPVELDGHLERLRDSVLELYAQDLPPNLADELREKSSGIDHGKARVTATPSGVAVESQGLVGHLLPYTGNKWPNVAVSLHSLTIPGGFGPHKWADRSLLDEAAAGLPAEGLSLIVDRDGAALEAARANLFAVRDGTLSTPPLDGRILPGVTRARVLTLASGAGIDAVEAPLTGADLVEADEVFLTGSVRGIEPAGALDGVELGRAGQVSAQLADALEGAWRGRRSPVG